MSDVQWQVGGLAAQLCICAMGASSSVCIGADLSGQRSLHCSNRGRGAALALPRLEMRNVKIGRQATQQQIVEGVVRPQWNCIGSCR